MITIGLSKVTQVMSQVMMSTKHQRAGTTLGRENWESLRPHDVNIRNDVLIYQGNHPKVTMFHGELW